MKVKEIKEKSVADRDRLEAQIRQDLVMSRLQLKAGQLANTAKIKTLRKDLARILTLRKASQGSIS